MAAQRKKLLLVNPRDNAKTYGELREIQHITKRPGGILGCSLPMVAALTPPDLEVHMIDEKVASIDYDTRWDLVGLTGIYTQLGRGRKIAQRFREKGIPVVCGGPSVTVSPERWRQASDVLVIGEAERIWTQCVKDFLSGNLQSEYRETERFELDITPIPDYGPMGPGLSNRYICGTIQASRGCPYNCEFCDAIIIAGRRMRYKPLDKVIGEMEALYRQGLRIAFFADDNFPANRKKSKEILSSIATWNRSHRNPMQFIMFMSIDVGKDEEFLQLAAAAGINRAYVGIETSNPDALKESNKRINFSIETKESVKKFHENGIMVIGGCMVGFDHDDLESFQRQFQFFQELGIPHVSVFTVHAPDGTPLKERMQREGRYIDYEEHCKDLENANLFNLYTIKPKQMTLEQLNQGTLWLMQQMYNLENFSNRFENFIGSCRQDHSLSSGKLDFKNLGLVGRLIKYLMFEAKAEERKTLFRMLKASRKSHHPHRYELAIGSFLFLLNTRCFIGELQKQKN